MSRRGKYASCWLALGLQSAVVMNQGMFSGIKVLVAGAHCRGVVAR